MNPLRRTKRTGGFRDDPLATRSPAAWPSPGPGAGGWAASADLHPAKPVKEKVSTASKTVAWGPRNSGGWGGGAIVEEEEEEEDYDDEEWEEEEQENGYGWGHTTNASAWGVQQPSSTSQPGWKSWSEEAKRLPKGAAPTPPGKPVLSHQQQSQILNSLLNQPPAQNGYIPAAQQQQMLKQQQHKQPQHKQTQPPRQATGNPYQWAPVSKKEKKKEQPAKHQRSQSEYADPRGAGSVTEGWGMDAGGWGKNAKNQDARRWSKDDSYGWGEDTGAGGWGQNDGGGGWGQDDGGWGSKDAGAWGSKEAGGWGSASVGGWGPIPEEEEEEYEYEEDPRKVHFSPKSAKAGRGGWGTESFYPGSVPSFRDSESSRASAANLWGSNKPKDTSYTMPSRTLAHAYSGTTTSLNTGIPRNKINEYTNVQFHDSQGAALEPYYRALFGRERKAKDRIHWMFPPNKDERVESLLTWIQTVSYSLGSYGLHRFLQSRERGALVANADYRLPNGKNEPAFDWLTFDDLQDTRDKTMQESVAFYDPSAQVIVFVFLPSKSGNSVAMWRRKINVPNNTRLMLQAETTLALAALRREEDYVVHVDEYPRAQTPKQKQTGIGQRLRRASLPSRHEYVDAYPMIIEETKHGKPKKKRKWWQFFRVDW
ncbi:hypothetical protein BDP27DRAFT_1313346 [Rhodocollybia butyracea]|uniref:CcmS related domain-containing protein n=1 Tax=Rhodocollybia butyracea TaxID=206335 RepID=A0A9P5Q7W3_9AGAR|nr:hypothetical protein BDP27DRAFT_1313346 [Rhodocollybia butyracea]